MKAVKIDCPGEAHENPYIDNCMICAPRWGYFLCCPHCSATLDKKSMKCKNSGCACVGTKFEES